MTLDDCYYLDYVLCFTRSPTLLNYLAFQSFDYERHLIGVLSETRRVTKLQCIYLRFYLEQFRQRDPKYPNTLNV